MAIGRCRIEEGDISQFLFFFIRPDWNIYQPVFAQLMGIDKDWTDNLSMFKKFTERTDAGCGTNRYCLSSSILTLIFGCLYIPIINKFYYRLK